MQSRNVDLKADIESITDYDFCSGEELLKLQIKLEELYTKLYYPESIHF